MSPAVIDEAATWLAADEQLFADLLASLAEILHERFGLPPGEVIPVLIAALERRSRGLA